MFLLNSPELHLQFKTIITVTQRMALTVYVFFAFFVLAFHLLYAHELVTCVSQFGKDASGCSYSGNCCSSLNKMVNDLKSSCEMMSSSTRITIEIQSDIDLTSVVHFENFCSSSSLTINGKMSIITCSNYNDIENDGLGLMTFTSVKNLSIFNLTMTKCSSLCNSSSTAPNVEGHMTTYNLTASMLFLLNCSCVNLSRLSILNGHGTRLGAALYDTAGNVSITDCLFEAGGGGLYNEFTKHTQEHQVIYQYNNIETYALISITRCNFTNNNNSHGPGGGLRLVTNKHYYVRIIDCYFLNNTALSGGGLFVEFKGSQSNNSIVVENCSFIQNKCYHGGGGACVGFNLPHASKNNVVNFTSCLFQGNIALRNCGGLSLYSNKGTSFALMENRFHLENCRWTNNSAFVASALDLAPEYHSLLDKDSLPISVIDNCIFDSNICINQPESSGSDEHFRVRISGLATVLISGFQVRFKRRMVFQLNKGTGLHLSLASVNIVEGSSLYFEGNIGKHGGGITMVAFSQLTIHDNCNLTFINNTSLTRGGAFNVQLIDYQHEAYFSHSCFIQYNGNQSKSISERNITFCFENNQALFKMGHVLFATSLRPCNCTTCDKPQQLFETLGHVDSNISEHDIVSLATKFAVGPKTLEDLQQIIPGKEIVMNITAFDDIHQIQNVVYEAFMLPDCPSSIKIDPAYTQVSNNVIKFHGNLSEGAGLLELETQTASLTINISLSECPPGFFNDGKSCVCSSLDGIVKCRDSVAHIVRGYWVGHCKNDKVCTAYCPFGYCAYNDASPELLRLPLRFNELDRFLCSKFRTGISCSQCRQNSSVYYHSHYYRCYPNKYCNLGVLFYIVSEILPLCIVFLIVTTLNVCFTTGAVNGFVLFAQISDSIDIRGHGSIHFPEAARLIIKPARLIYGIFNFDFFSQFETLSFCMWKSATTLDMMAMKYVTITFAICLVVGIVFILNSWKCKVLCVWFRPTTL